MCSILIIFTWSKVEDHTDLECAQGHKIRNSQNSIQNLNFGSQIYGLSATLNQYYKKLFSQFFRKTAKTQ